MFYTLARIDAQDTTELMTIHQMHGQSHPSAHDEWARRSVVGVDPRGPALTYSSPFRKPRAASACPCSRRACAPVLRPAGQSTRPAYRYTASLLVESTAIGPAAQSTRPAYRYTASHLVESTAIGPAAQSTRPAYRYTTSQLSGDVDK